VGERMITPKQDPYTRAQELREGATPTTQEAFAFTLHLHGHDPGRSAAWQVAAHLSRGQIRAILNR
jgi:hypothetical protein